MSNVSTNSVLCVNCHSAMRESAKKTETAKKIETDKQISDLNIRRQATEDCEESENVNSVNIFNNLEAIASLVKVEEAYQ